MGSMMLKVWGHYRQSLGSIGPKIGVSGRDVGWGQQDPKFGVNGVRIGGQLEGYGLGSMMPKVWDQWGQSLESMGPKLGVNRAKIGGQCEGHRLGSTGPKVWGQ